jgi:hypothetical protein
MKRKDKKKVIIISSIVSAIFMVTVLTIALVGGKEDAPVVEVPGIEEYAEETVEFGFENRMIEDQQTVYWDIGAPSNSTDAVIVTGIQILITWSDDEPTPAGRVLYENEPDEFFLSVEGIPLLQGSTTTTENLTQNRTIRVASNSDMGSARVNFNILDNPILLSSQNLTVDNKTGLEWDPAGKDGPGNTGLFINVSCIAGHIEARRPALLRYTDQGDQIMMSVALSFKTIPHDILENWVESNTRSIA